MEIEDIRTDEDPEQGLRTTTGGTMPRGSTATVSAATAATPVMTRKDVSSTSIIRAYRGSAQIPSSCFFFAS